MFEDVCHQIYWNRGEVWYSPQRLDYMHSSWLRYILFVCSYNTFALRPRWGALFNSCSGSVYKVYYRYKIYPPELSQREFILWILQPFQNKCPMLLCFFWIVLNLFPSKTWGFICPPKYSVEVLLTHEYLFATLPQLGRILRYHLRQQTSVTIW